MKKLMIAAAIVCAAAFAHAGAYTWGLRSGEDETSDGGYLTETDFTVMLFVGSIGQTSNGDGTYTLDFSNATYVNKTSSYASGSYYIGDFPFASDRTSTAVDASKQQAYSILVLDTGSGISDYANYEGTYAVVTGNSVLKQDPESSTDYSAFVSSTQVTESMYRTAASVPEPTSGLLLLLGVAGMALRRRRA